jgi:predicted Co/Zn/Cd cation transporter (cation efflux family)
MKNKSGVVTTCLTLLLAVAGLIAYFVNARTAFFANLGIDPLIVGLTVVSILALVCWFLAGGRNRIADVLPIIAPACLMAAAVVLLNSRINGIASIMTFTNNAQNMADLGSGIAAIAALFLAAVVGMINGFADIRK